MKPKLDLTWDLLAAGAAPPLTVIAPVDKGVVNVTQKWAGLLSFGALEADGRRYSLDGGVGGLDYTHGYLARETSWRWAFVCGRLDDGTPIGINLVEGFNESRDDVNENALWLGNELIAPGARALHLEPQRHPRARGGAHRPTARSTCTSSRWAAHTELRDLKLVKSSFKQPVGLWDGEVKVGDRIYVLQDAPGVAEDQSVLW